ncbi:MAG: bifunctional DNA-formamidopyrimidine glycosylase/DNA-(apurinic or apyrimidinic site) lyase [bacterium]|nr:bifunctional DNA-formamidopyrimidine glycosylase/DNA-(apurinic or apyrimidinic site) lyase [bacterium]
MPELPEIETLAQGLRKVVQGKTIKNLEIFEKKQFKGTAQELKKFVYKKKIKAINRKAKWLMIELSSGYSFIVHLRMTGQLLYQKNKKSSFLGGHTPGNEIITYPNSHTRIIFNFTDNSQLFFQDQRKFGYIQLYSPQEVSDYFTSRDLGLEPLDKNFTFEYFNDQLKRRSRTSIKAALLNQSVLSGIGNIYADDICWTAKVRPTRKVGTLTISEKKALHVASKKIIQQAIKLGGTTFSHYLQVDGKLGQYWKYRKVYGRTNEPCRKCKTPIKKIRTAGRGTHYCPQCQPA